MFEIIVAINLCAIWVILIYNGFMRVRDIKSNVRLIEATRKSFNGIFDLLRDLNKMIMDLEKELAELKGGKRAY